MSYTPQQFERLPKWAQIEISRLKRDLKFHQEEHLRIASGGILESETNTQADPYADIPQRLPNNTTIAFRLEDGTRNGVVRARVANGRLNINGDTGISIRPNSSNDITIGLEKW